MTEKKYTILISGIACLLAIVLTLCSVTTSHAEESYSDCKKIHGGKWSDVNDVSWLDDGMPHADAQLTDTQLQTYPKSEAFTYRYSSPRLGHESIRVGWKNASDQPVLVFLAPVTEEDAKLLGLSNSFIGSIYSAIISKDQFCFKYQSAHLKTIKNDDGIETTVNDANDVYMSSQSGASTKNIAGNRYYYVGTQNFISFDCDLFANNFSCFTSAQDAIDYLEDGDTSKIAWGKDSRTSQEYNSELAFTSFDMSVHDSNSFDDYYLEFIYKCPDSWLGKNPKLVINQTWDYNIYYFDSKSTSTPLTVNGSNTYALSVSGEKNSIKVSLGQLDCLKEFVSSANNLLGASSEMKRRVLGSSYSSPPLGSVLTFNGFPIKGDSSYKVDKSFLTLSCVVYVDGVAGHDYSGTVDLISGDNTMASYTPDASGNYTYNDDHKKGGHYYTDVGKDAAGNTTYNYYYYYPDGSKKDVSSDDAASNTISNTVQEGAIRIDNSPTFNNNITVEGDTISNDVNNYVDGKSDSDTNKSFIDKLLGFFEIIENNSFLGVFGKIFGWLPTGVSSLITTALGIVVGIRVFNAFH